ncbi:programmed cell death 1 ligand 1-like [Astatotilapia calliptera]|uniref:programmed cell death 1 ligand 1-like n=1 Tax=Astatotilapia calliptera TaxID=8154 RepID=UPI000E4265C5|nr:programmed cell death 1 ligand 1-like [Astatotilapia calliptera]
MNCRISLVLILTSCVSGSFVVNVTQTSCQAEENHNITLEWTFTVETGRSPTYLNIYCELITDDKLSVLYHVHNGAEVSESQDEKFSGRVQGDKDALREGRIRLQLCKLRTEDSGQYKCQVNTDYGFSSASCRLNVTALLKKAQQRLHFMRVQRWNRLQTDLLVSFYRATIQSVLVHAIPVRYADCTTANKKRL